MQLGTSVAIPVVLLHRRFPAGVTDLSVLPNGQTNTETHSISYVTGIGDPFHGGAAAPQFPTRLYALHKNKLTGL